MIEMPFYDERPKPARTQATISIPDLDESVDGTAFWFNKYNKAWKRINRQQATIRFQWVCMGLLGLALALALSQMT